MPGPAAMLAPAGERVVVEEVLSVERKAAERAVIERQLHHVRIARVPLDKNHAVRPEDQSDRGAGFRIGGFVRQIVVGGEALVARGGTKAAGNIEPLRGEVRPKCFAGCHQARVVELSGEIGHRAVQIHGAHRVPDNCALLAHRQVRLAVLVGAVVLRRRIFASRNRLLVEAVRLTAALIDKILGKVRDNGARW